MSARDTSLQKPDLNRHYTPYEGAAFPVEPFCNGSGYRSRTCYLQLMRLKLVIPFHPPAKPVPGIEPGSSAWKADVLAVTPHGQKSELQESNLRKLLIRQVPYHWTKLQERE